MKILTLLALLVFLAGIAIAADQIGKFRHTPGHTDGISDPSDSVNGQTSPECRSNDDCSGGKECNGGGCVCPIGTLDCGSGSCQPPIGEYLCSQRQVPK